MKEKNFEELWVPNSGPSCTSASILSGLRLLGLKTPCTIEEASRWIMGQALAMPSISDYLGVFGQRSQLDEGVESLALHLGFAVNSHTKLVLPFWPLHAHPREALIANLMLGEEREKRWGSWGINFLWPPTYKTGGHSVLVLQTHPHWIVVDPNRGVCEWTRPGVAATVTRIRRGVDLEVIRTPIPFPVPVS